MTTTLRHRQRYQEVGAEVSAKCYDAYKKSWGTIAFDGGAKGAFAAIVSAMSYNSEGEAASAQMLGIHAALGTLWLALVIKDYAYAGSTYLKKDKEELEEIGKRVLLYAKLKSDPSCARDASNSQSLPNATEINKKLIEAINDGLKRENFAPLDEEATMEEIKSLATQRSKIGKPHVLAAIGAAAGTLTLAGTATIAVAKATGSAETLAAGVSITAVAGATTAITGAALSASARNSKKVIRTISSAIGSLIDNEFGHVEKTVIDSKKLAVEEEIRSGANINPLRTLQTREARTALTPASIAAASGAVALSLSPQSVQQV